MVESSYNPLAKLKQANIVGLVRKLEMGRFILDHWNKTKWVKWIYSGRIGSHVPSLNKTT